MVSRTRYAQPVYTVVPLLINTKDPPYRMPYGWNTEDPQVTKEYEQTGVNNASVGWGVGPTSTFKAGPQAQQASGAQPQPGQGAQAAQPFFIPRGIAAYIYDDKILIHCFHDSLTGAALS
ncbi:hypothetical protein CR513_16987, partial [Mucuna pruriens]